MTIDVKTLPNYKFITNTFKEIYAREPDARECVRFQKIIDICQTAADNYGLNDLSDNLIERRMMSALHMIHFLMSCKHVGFTISLKDFITQLYVILKDKVDDNTIYELADDIIMQIDRCDL